MVPLRELKVKSAVGVEDKGDSIQVADPQNSTRKRDVQKMRDEIKVESLKLRRPSNRLNIMYTQCSKIHYRTNNISISTFGIQILFKKNSSYRNLILRKESIVIMKLKWI